MGNAILWIEWLFHLFKVQQTVLYFILFDFRIGTHMEKYSKLIENYNLVT